MEAQSENHPANLCVIDRIAQGEKVDLETVMLPETPQRFSRMSDEVGDYSWFVLPCGTMSTASDNLLISAQKVSCGNCGRVFDIIESLAGDAKSNVTEFLAKAQLRSQIQN